MIKNNRNNMVIGSVAMFAIAQVQAASIYVPNGSFETLYKPGSTTITADTGGGWTHGVGPNAQVEGAVATYSDATTGTAVDIPGWVNAGGGWLPPYGWTSGSGSVARQSPALDGLYSYLTNGTDWGCAYGGAIESAGALATLVSGESYTLSMSVITYAGNAPAVVPVTLELLANGVALTPTSAAGSSSPLDVWNTYSNTYDAASLTGAIGKSLTIRVGWAIGASGGQSQLDNVQLTSSAIPEPTAALLGGLGLLSLLRRRRNA
jgi:hypothetical protein